MSENPYQRILSDPQKANEAIAELLRNEPEEKRNVNVGLFIISFWHLVVSAVIALAAYAMFELEELSAVVIFAACMVHSLHRGLMAVCIDLCNQTRIQGQVSNNLRALVIELYANHKKQP